MPSSSRRRAGGVPPHAHLHDGAQPRLVILALRLREVQARLADDPEAAAQLLATARDELARALDELRTLARGVHPLLLTQRGLGPAVERLLTRAPATVKIDALPGERLPEPVETAAYYLAEAVTNAARHANAGSVTVRVIPAGDRLRVEVRDDGVGGADARRGSGLRGLGQRFRALGGVVTVASPRGGGTTVIGELPAHRAASRPASLAGPWAWRTATAAAGRPSS